jgi:hypothetical protein
VLRLSISLTCRHASGEFEIDYLPAGSLRWRCLAEIDRMMVWTPPVAGNGLACAIAARSSAYTSGFASTAAFGSLMKRFCFPVPCRILFGSGKVAPWLKERPTPLALIGF